LLQKMPRNLLFVALIAGGFQQQQQQPSPQQQQSEQQRQDAIQRQQEQQRKDAEDQRRKQMADLLGSGPVDLKKTAPRQVTEPCLAQTLAGDAAVNVEAIPLAEWLKAQETTEIPWKVQIRNAQLRMDQRTEIAYSVVIPGKDLRWSGGAHELIYVSGISAPDGRWLVAPKAGREVFAPGRYQDVQVRFSDCLLVRPGDYILWMVLYDRETERHNMVKRRIRIAERADDALPDLHKALPPAAFPQLAGPKNQAAETSPGELFLPVSNKGPVALELIATLSPPDQWAGRLDVIRGTNSRVLSAVGTLSQMKLADGLLSASVLDLVNHKLAFRQQDFAQLDWTRLVSTFTNLAGDHTVSLPALQTLKERGTFLRQFVSERLDNPGGIPRVLILLSSSLLFERGSDMTPIKPEGDCRCRLFHVRFRVGKDDVFDDLGDIIKPLRPRTFNVDSPIDFRRAIAEIIHDLESP
jgi:hypothetical protein